MKILTIEDEKSIQELYKILLPVDQGFEIHQAYTNRTALDMLQKPYDVIVFDGCIESSEHDTGALIRLAKRMKAASIIVATSSSESLQKLMISEGCTVSMNKEQVASFIKSLKEPVSG